jgi:hypothetical protein
MQSLTKNYPLILESIRKKKTKPLQKGRRQT